MAKIIAPDAHEFSIVQQFAATPTHARELMIFIGGGETLLALGVLSGLFSRALSALQIIFLLAMNIIGICFGGGTISNPAGLLIHNLPLLACMVLLGLHGPGALALKLKPKRHDE